MAAADAQNARRRPYAVRAKNLSKQFKMVDAGSAWKLAFGGAKNVETHQALSDVTISAPKGHFTGVLGLNGAGKTTLLRTLGGVYAPDGGVVSINGAMTGIYELGVGGSGFLTGHQYARRLLAMRGTYGKAQEALIKDIREFSELGDRFDDNVQSYSTGMAARLYFAVATAGYYDVYLIDEVLSVGDTYFQAKCWRRIRDRLSKGASGILCTHDWSAILKVCSHAVILDKGRIIFEGPPERVARKYLYGEDAGVKRTEGIARILEAPKGQMTVTSGSTLHIPLTIEIERQERVFAVAAVERLSTGAGWETMLMSRTPDPVGTRPGVYTVDLMIPSTPLPPGDYVMSAALVTADEKGGSRVVLDGFDWLSGTGLAIEVTGRDGAEGLPLPVRWDASAA